MLVFFFVAVDSTPDLGAFLHSSILLLLPFLCNEKKFCSGYMLRGAAKSWQGVL